MNKMFSTLHWVITVLLVCIAFSSYNKLRTLEEEFGYMIDVQRTIILNTLVEKELKIEEDSHRDGVPRSSSDPLSAASTEFEL